jgi:hypothetical protein
MNAGRRMLQRGKLAVLAMFALAAFAAGFAWWWNMGRGRRALEFFGPETAELIRTAPNVEIITIRWRDPEGELFIAGNRVAVQAQIDISRAPGLLHARTSLLNDASYRPEPLEGVAQRSTEIIRFADGERETMVAMSAEDGVVHNLTSQRSLQFVEKTAKGWRSFLQRQLQNVKQSPADPP